MIKQSVDAAYLTTKSRSLWLLSCDIVFFLTPSSQQSCLLLICGNFFIVDQHKTQLTRRLSAKAASLIIYYFRHCSMLRSWKNWTPQQVCKLNRKVSMTVRQILQQMNYSNR